MKTASAKKKARKSKATAAAKPAAKAKAKPAAAAQPAEKKLVGLAATAAAKAADFSKAAKAANKSEALDIADAKDSEGFDYTKRSLSSLETAAKVYLLYIVATKRSEMKGKVPYITLENIGKALEHDYKAKGLISSGCKLVYKTHFYKFMTALYNLRAVYKKDKQTGEIIRSTKYMKQHCFCISKKADGRNDNFSISSGFLVISQSFYKRSCEIMKGMKKGTLPAECSPLKSLFS